MDERNEIIARWFKSKEVKRYFDIWMAQNRDYADLQLKDDLKQEVFFSLLNKPMDFIKTKDATGEWRPYINKMILNPRGRKDKFYLKHLGRMGYLREIPITLSESGDAEQESHLLELQKKCVDETLKLPYKQQLCLVAYAKYKNQGAATQALVNNGVIPSGNNGTFSKLLREAQNMVQERLYISGATSRKIVYKKIGRRYGKYQPDRFNKFKTARHLTRLTKMLSTCYNKSWTLADKFLYFIVNSQVPLTSEDIYNLMESRFEPEVVNTGKVRFMDLIGGYIREFVNSGVIGKQQTGNGPQKRYFLKPEVQDYLIGIKREGQETVIAATWCIYIAYNELHTPLDALTNDYGFSSKEIITKLRFADRFLMGIENEMLTPK